MDNFVAEEFLKTIFNCNPSKETIEGYNFAALDWDYLKETISSRKFLGIILYCNFRKINFLHAVPPGLQAELRKTYLLNLARNTILLNEFVKIQSAFQARDIALMPLKGMALLFSVYKNLGLRPMTDIDFLIKKEDAEKAKDLLLDLGFKKDDAPFNYSKIKGRKRILLDMQYDIWYLKTLSRAQSHIYNIEKIWQEASRFYLDDGNSAQIMAAEDLLINVTAHAGVDHDKVVDIWLYDIVSICGVYKENFRWDIFIDKVISYNLQIPIHYLLKLARGRFSAQIPQFILDELKPATNKFFEVKLYESILKGFSIPRVGHFLRIITSNRLSSKLRLILFYLFPDKKFMILRYKIKKKNLVYFYYPLRAISFLPKILKIIMRLLIGRFKWQQNI